MLNLELQHLKSSATPNPASTTTGLSPGEYAARLAKFGYNLRRIRGKPARRVTPLLGGESLLCSEEI